MFCYWLFVLFCFGVLVGGFWVVVVVFYAFFLS